MKGFENFLREFASSCFAHRFDAGANSATGFGNLFVGCAGNALFKIDETGINEGRMGVGIDKTRKHDLTFAIDLDHLPAIFSQPRIAKGVFGCAHRDNFAAQAKDSGVFDDAEFLESGPAARAGLAASRAVVRIALVAPVAAVARPIGARTPAVTGGLRPGVDQDDACADPDVLPREVL